MEVLTNCPYLPGFWDKNDRGWGGFFEDFPGVLGALVKNRRIPRNAP